MCLDVDSDDDGLGDVLEISELQMRGEYLGHVTVVRSTLGRFGREHHAVGDATLTGYFDPDEDDDGLRVSNIGSSGKDGVVVDVDRDGRLDVVATTLDLDPISGTGPMMLQLGARGDVVGQPAQVISTARVRADAGLQSVEIDPLPWMAPESIRVLVFNDGAKVAVARGLPPSIVASVFADRMPRTAEVRLLPSDAAGGTVDGVKHTFVWDAAVDIMLPGLPPASGDELRIVARPDGGVAGDALPAVRLRRLEVLAAGTSELQITDETYERAEPACPADVNGDQQIGVDDLLALILAWGTSDPVADLDGSGLVDVNDLLALILAWGPCA
jgi:hypothetical protein